MAKYEVTVASSATSLYEIDGEAGRNLIAGLAFGHMHPHIPNILSNAYNGLAVRIHQAYNYGRDYYTYGLPNGYEEIIGDPPIESIEDALEEELGYAVQVHSASREAPDDNFFARMYAHKHWGYKEGTGVVHNSPIAPNRGENVTIEDTYWTGRNSNLAIVLNLGKPSWPTESEDELSTVTISNSALDPTPNHGALYYHVQYTPLGATTPNHSFWVYEVGSGDHPALDDITYDDLGSPFLPIIPLRQDNTNLGPKVEDGDYVLDEDGSRIKPDTELYRTSVKLCNKLDTDFDRLCLEVSTNPSVDDIDHAYLIFGIDIRSTSSTGKEYLYDYFEDLVVKRPGARTIQIQDAKYKVAMAYSNSARTVNTGTLNLPVEITYAGNTIILRKDFKDGTYGQVVLNDLEHTNYIYEDHAVVTTLEDSAAGDNYNFIVPINIDVFENFRGLIRRQDLLKEAFKIVFNSYERRKLKWYETDIFKSLLLIASIVITIWSLGTLAAGIAAAYASGGIGAAISAASTMILTSLAISTGVKWLASNIDPELAILIAIVLTAIAVSGYTTDMGIDFLDSEGMLNLTNSITEGIQMGIEDELAELADEMQDFMDDANAAQEELDALINELDTSVEWFDTLIAERTDPIIIETPTEFYTRTIHAGNIGVATLSQIENYVDNALELPELTQI